MAGSDTKGGSAKGAQTSPRPLSAREREVLGMLAEGLSGAAIASRLVLSPETVRTHVRNAMDKLGASTRSQAVALALESGQIGEADEPAAPRPVAPARGPAPAPLAATPSATLTALLSGVASLADVDAASVYFAQEGGLRLELAAHASGAETIIPAPPQELTLGEGAIGSVALERRARLVSAPNAAPGSAPMLVTPMVSGGRVLGILCLRVRASRPTSRRELLLLEAFGNRIAEIVGAGGDLAPGLRSALQRFRASWTGTLEG